MNAHMGDEMELVSACVALGATRAGGRLSRAESKLVKRSRCLRRALDFDQRCTLEQIRHAVLSGEDPLGQAFCLLRSNEQRRSMGAFYTGPQIVAAMLAWVLERNPARLVDAGCGSGRFAIAAHRMGFTGELIAVDADPIATLMTRAHLAIVEAPEVRVIHGDFLRLRLADAPPNCRTAFVGNPPYVRHHKLAPALKRWAQQTAGTLGLRISGLAGLHVLFFLAAMRASRSQDLGCFVTAAEWLDVGYGAILRSLLAGRMGAVRLDMIDPRARPFGDAMTTAVITSWELGYSGQINVRKIQTPASLGSLSNGRAIARKRLTRIRRWSDLLRAERASNGLVPLGTFARVHRGVATGANDFFLLTREEAVRWGLARHVRPCLVRAAEVITAGGVVRAEKADHVLLDVTEGADADPALRRYLALGRGRRVPNRYLCAHRRPWWRVGGTQPPSVIATYMARQPPVFAANPDRCQIVNVFHGIHFRDPVNDATITALVGWLNTHRATLRGGRTYHGGLRKFEPRELEALLVPALEQLRTGRM